MKFLHLCENDLLASILPANWIFHSCNMGMFTILVVKLLIFLELILLFNVVSYRHFGFATVFVKFFTGEGGDQRLIPTIKVCLVEVKSKRTENSGEKMVELCCFFLRPTKTQSPQIREKTQEKLRSKMLLVFYFFWKILPKPYH